MKIEEALAQRQWYVIDAQGKVLGRMASEIAKILRGKNKPIFTPNVDAGDFVIVVNARGLNRGKNFKRRFTIAIPNIRGHGQRTAEKMLEEKPEDLVLLAVKGMLPKNRLSKRLVTELKVYAGPEHPHEAQKPQPLVV